MYRADARIGRRERRGYSGAGLQLTHETLVG